MLVVILNMTRGHTVTDHAMLLYLDQKDLAEDETNLTFMTLSKIKHLK